MAMTGRKRRRSGRSTRSKKRFARRRFVRAYRRSRRVRNNSYIRIKRTCYLGVISPNSVSTSGFWQYRWVSLNSGFADATGSSLGGLSNLGEYTALFDQYKLSAFKIVLRPRVVNMNAGQDAPSGGTFRERPYISVVKDPYDKTTPGGIYNLSTLNSFLECGKARTYDGTRTLTLYMKPKVEEQYGGGATRYVSPKWTDLTTAGMTMQHRGFHMFFHTQGMTSTAFINYDVWITYYVQFRGQK